MKFDKKKFPKTSQAFGDRAIRDCRRDVSELAKEESNPYEFYVSNTQLLNDAASFSYNKAVGSVLNTGVSEALMTVLNQTDNNNPNVKISFNTLHSKEVFPGVTVFKLIHSPGIATASDGIDAAALNVGKQLFNRKVRHANSGSRNYESSDLMLYALALAEAYSWHAFMVRIYGLATEFAQRNRYMPDGVLYAMGIDTKDVCDDDLANFRKFINRYAMKVNSLAAPRDWTLYARRTWIYSHIFKDSPNPKSQYYLYAPDMYYVYDPILTTSGGGLKAKEVRPSDLLLTLDDIKRIANEIITPLLEDEDCNTMSGDIEKWAGDNLWKLHTISEDYAISPIYNRTDLNQIQNITICGKPGFIDDVDGRLFTSDYEALNITQEGNNLKWSPGFWTPDASVFMNRVFTLPLAEVHPAETIDAAPLTVIGKADSTKNLEVTIDDHYWHNGDEYSVADGYFYFLDSTGTEVCSSMEIVTRTNRDTLPYETTKYYSNGLVLNPPVSNEYNPSMMADQVAKLSMFAAHPTMYTLWRILSVDGNDNTSRNDFFCGYMGELDTTRLMTAADLNGLHECALLSEFNIPTES